MASVLSKKIAAGSTHAVIDIPVGETAKVRTPGDAERLASFSQALGGLWAEGTLHRDRRQQAGWCRIGPTEEARMFWPCCRESGVRRRIYGAAPSCWLAICSIWLMVVA